MYDIASLNGIGFAIPSNDYGMFNLMASINYLLSKATSRYIEGSNGWCAQRVFDALDFGNLCGTHSDAYLAGTYIMQLGYMPIEGFADYTPSLGDIVVFDSNPYHKWGHVQMWCGSEWVSDFRQGYRGFYPEFIQGNMGFSPYTTNTTPTFTIYRYPKWLLFKY
jgi:hypothetical protein